MSERERGTMSIGEVSRLAARAVAEVEKAVVGKGETLRLIMAAFLSPGGHVLLEDYPGLAKTLVANSFARALGLSFKRIQFTPDLLPGDITGGYVFDASQGKFVLRKGPVFANVLLADEINRASPKTQSALLEAMQEGQVTLEGETMPPPRPFIVVATQNPIEYEGTFPLPEAQLDRFMVKLSIGYPEPEEEAEILRRRIERRDDTAELESVLDEPSFLGMREAIEGVHVDEDLGRYIAAIASKTRGFPKVAVGASPRGSLALLKLARSWAAMEGRDYALPDDVKLFAKSALAHRLVLDSSLWDLSRSEELIVAEILRAVPVPLLAKLDD
jgi:MoxR-like ATPase